MALLWAAGICWMAVEIVGSPPDEENTTAATTDVTGAEISPEDVKRVEETLKRL